jgi:hypothetical protein
MCRFSKVRCSLYSKYVPLNSVSTIVRVKWVPFTCMMRPEVADAGKGFEIWRTAANVFNRQSRTTDKGQYFSLEVGLGANNYTL